MAERYDIAISGGGIAGLVAACLFGARGYRVICADPNPPVTERDAQGADHRSTALLQPSIPVLERAGLWHRLQDHATPLQVMRIVDAAGGDMIARDFNAADISDLPFGWNLPNWLIRRELLKTVEALDMVTFLPGRSVTGVFARSEVAQLRLSDGAQVTADLVLAADGRHSVLRARAGINVTTRRYGQKALAFAVTHPVPHENVSTEIHRSGGPFTLVPLPDRDGRPASAVVWMDTGAEMSRRMELTDAEFEAEMSDRSAHLFGPLTLASPRSIWPIISQIAHCFRARRLALVAEAAHVVPPIGAQGLNMSLADLACLEGLAGQSALGGPEMLAAYDRQRRWDIRARVLGIDALNRTSLSGLPMIQTLRNSGIRALYDLAPLRKTVMRLGLGTI